MEIRIGNVIEKHRITLGMTRRELSENICSEKYIYMIEKGKRRPSAFIVRMLGDKIGIDLFKYSEYVDCEDPISVSSTIEKFNIYRMNNESELLAKATLEAVKLPDFKKAPWKYEIECNKYTIKVLGKGEYRDSIKEISKIISDIKHDSSLTICIINFYVLLSTCYHMSGDIENAKKAIFIANGLIEKKGKIYRYVQVVVTVKICKISVHYLAGELDRVIEEGIDLVKYEEEHCFYERSHYTYFFLALSNYQRGFEEEAMEWFIKALCATLIRYKPMDIFYIKKFATFDELIKDNRIPKCLVSMFMDKYGINSQ
ncbi:MAG: helix-turn-helix transcriptional regulator [Clostridiaceae bacterium]|nr:helix-turn-helix transcriptional regulator [Clostridiaceae bacterium]